MQVSFAENASNTTDFTFNFSGEQMSATFSLPFAPKLAYLNGNEGIMNAVTARNYYITSSGTLLDDYSYSRVISPSSNAPNNEWVRIEHCRIAPDQNIDDNLGVQLSTERYWRVDGIWDENFVWNTWFIYDGRNTASGNLDADLLVNPHGVGFHEDSLKLMYRPNANAPWTIVEDAVMNTQGSATDGSGRFVANNVQKGEYTFGFKYSSLGIDKNEQVSFIVYPNPAEGSFQIQVPNNTLSDEFQLVLYDANGNRVLEKTITNGETISTSNFSPGMYLVELYVQNQKIGMHKVLVK
jgi:hypothetical protein